MAEDMILRGAKAAFFANTVEGVTLNDDAWAFCDMYKKAVLSDMVRAALLAALDPEDEALVGAVADAIEDSTGGAAGSYSAAQAALVALKRIAQGGRG